MWEMALAMQQHLVVQELSPFSSKINSRLSLKISAKGHVMSTDATSYIRTKISSALSLNSILIIRKGAAWLDDNLKNLSISSIIERERLW